MMQVSLEEAYAEACRALGEQIVTLRLMDKAAPKVPSAPPVALERDGVKVYGPHPDGSYTASWGGQWLKGSWPNPEAAYVGAMEQFTAPNLDATTTGGTP